MNKNGSIAIATVIGVLFLIGVFTAVYFKYGDNIIPQEAFSDDDCEMIKNVNNAQLGYTLETSNSTYKCDADECIVWGRMRAEKATQTNTKTCSPCLSNNGKNAATYLVNQGKYEYAERCYSTSSADSIPRDCSSSYYSCWWACSGADIFSYAAYFNFGTFAGFPYSEGGSKNFASSSSPTDFYTTRDVASGIDGTKRIAKGTTFTFSPKYPDGTAVTSKSIFVQRGDCTCTSSDVACELGQEKCLRCPSGFTYKDYTVYSCDEIDGEEYTDSRYSGGICVSNSDNSICYTPYKYKQKCDSSHAAGDYGGSCKWWGTQSACSGDMHCYSDDQLKEGLGGCKCSDNDCTLGEMLINNVDNRQFKKCVTDSSECVKWESSWRSCPLGLIFDGKSCVCSPDGFCDSSKQTIDCITSDTYKTCSATSIYDENFGNTRTCSRWSNTLTITESNKECDLATDTIKNKAGCAYGGTTCRANQWCDTSTITSGECKCKTSVQDAAYCTQNTPATCQDNYHRKYCASDNNGCYIQKIENQTNTAKYCSSGNWVCYTSPEPYCASGAASSCSSGKVKSCNLNTTTDCYNYVLSSCATDKICKGSGTCSCKTPAEDSNFCTQGSKNCSANTPLLCSNNFASGCWKWVAQTACPTGEMCLAGDCVSVGCQFNTAGYVCDSTAKDTNNILLESCVSNHCQCRVDNYSCSETESGNKRCYNNKIQECVKKPATPASLNKPSNTCYRYETVTGGDCSGETPYCRATDFKCVSSMENFYFMCPENCSFAAGYAIDNLTFYIQPNVGDVSGKTLSIFLLDKDKKQVSGVGSKMTWRIPSTVPFSILCSKCISADCSSWCKTNITRGDYFIKAVLDYSGTNLTITQPISIKAGMKIKLNCPDIAYIGRDTECSWLLYDDKNVLLSGGTPTISVMQGSTDITKTSFSDRLTFSSNEAGTAYINIEIAKSGYINARASDEVEIQSTTSHYTLLVDGKKMSEYVGGIVPDGVHEVEIQIDESGEPVEILGIEMTVKTPSGQDVAIPLVKTEKGYKGSYNFEQKGYTYSLSGVVKFPGEKDDLPIRDGITTAGESSFPKTNSYTWIITGVILGIIVIIVIMVLVLKPRKKKK